MAAATSRNPRNTMGRSPLRELRRGYGDHPPCQNRGRFVPHPPFVERGSLRPRRERIMPGAHRHLEDGPMPLQAIVFDLDGVLIDSEPVWEVVRRAYVDERGGRWLPDTQERLMGMSTEEWAGYLASDLV